MRIANVFVSLYCAAALAAALPATAASSLEDAIESYSPGITLPAAVPGGMLNKSCPACQTQSLQVTSGSRFYVGKEPVSLAELQRRFNSGRYNVFIGLIPNTSIVRRIVITDEVSSR